MKYNIIEDDVLKALKKIPDNTHNAILSDPPYGLNFMNKKWDYDVPSVEVFQEMLRVIKPGSHILCFGGSRTFHRMAVNLEDAGFQIRDTIIWMYGSGFPKSYNIGKGMRKKLGEESDQAKIWEGMGTALKPAYEPIILAMKPLNGNNVNNALKYGVAGLNIDESRVEFNNEADKETCSGGFERFVKGNYDVYNYFSEHSDSNTKSSKQNLSNNKGRHPANIILDEEAGELLDEQSGILKSGKVKPFEEKCVKEHRFTNHKVRDCNREASEGGASRFFYQAKASKKERNAGCETNTHPTLKPLKLTEYLANLIKAPVGSNILIPYSGSGSEMIGAMKAGYEHITGIERETEYITIAKKRLEYWKEDMRTVFDD